MLFGRSAPFLPGAGLAGYSLGIASFSLVLLAAAYWLRTRYEPPAWKSSEDAAPQRTSALSETREKLADLEADALKSGDPRFLSLRITAARLLKKAGLRAAYRLVVRRDAEGRPYIRMEPRDPAHSLSNWLLGHQYLGGLALFFVGLHCGFSARSPVGIAALSLMTLVVLSGLVGTVIYALVPARLRRLEAALREAKSPDAVLASRCARYEAVLKVWLYVHTPATVALLTILAIHVLSVLCY